MNVEYKLQSDTLVCQLQYHRLDLICRQMSPASPQMNKHRPDVSVNKLGVHSLTLILFILFVGCG